jgi:hypothetical protein
MLLSLASAKGALKVKAAGGEKWNTARYGDVLDIGTKLRAQEKDPAYRAKMDEQIKEMAKTMNFDESAAQSGSEAQSSFTFDGGAKIFLGYDIRKGYVLKYYTLRSIGENVEVWVANNLAWQPGDTRPAPEITQEQVDKMRDVFDQKVYPTDTNFFGTPDSHTGEEAALPGMVGLPADYYISADNIERVIILVDNIKDDNYYNPTYPFFIAGFYSSSYEGYIDRNIISIDSLDWATRLDTTHLPTTAHEFQHLIHDDNDPSEESWINEGMADFAEYLCFDKHPMGHVNFFLDHPENSLVEWDDQLNAPTGPETLADYGQAYLLQLYLNDHYGRDFIQTLAKDTDQGIASVNKILKEFNTKIDFEELFRRFTIALAIDKNVPGNGEYYFKSIDLKIDYESAKTYAKDGVPAWGADYMKIDNSSKIQDIIFDGIEFLPMPWKVVDDPAGSGEKVFWGSNGNMQDNQLIFEADLTGKTAATLMFDNYTDIEEGWDAGMVQVSTDNGQTWTSLANENTVDQDTLDENGDPVFPLNDQAPEIYNNLPGFTGYTNGWRIGESFDLTPFAGQKVFINFRYMTDAAYNDTGWFIDNIRIPEIGYSNGCGSLDGFMTIDQLRKNPIEYAVSFINEKFTGKGNKNVSYQILNIDPFNITQADSLKLKGFLNDGNNYMIVWYAAPIGKKGVVDYSYELVFKDNGKKK